MENLTFEQRCQNILDSLEEVNSNLKEMIEALNQFNNGK